MRAVILAGGLGTRLRPRTYEVPKPLLQLDGTPMTEILVRQLEQCGVEKLTLALHYKASTVRDHFEDIAGTLSLEISYSSADELLGTAGPLGVLDPPSEPMIVTNCDILADVDYSRLMRSHEENEACMTTVVVSIEQDVEYGVVRVDDRGMVHELDEKPSNKMLINSGIYALSPEIWDYLSPGEHLDMPELMQRILADDRHIKTYLHAGRWLDIGTPDDYEHATHVFTRYRDSFLAPPAPPPFVQDAVVAVANSVAVSDTPGVQ